MRLRRLAGAGGRAERADVHGPIVHEGDRRPDRLGFDQRLVALHVDREVVGAGRVDFGQLVQLIKKAKEPIFYVVFARRRPAAISRPLRL